MGRAVRDGPPAGGERHLRGGGVAQRNEARQGDVAPLARTPDAAARGEHGGRPQGRGMARKAAGGRDGGGSVQGNFRRTVVSEPARPVLRRHRHRGDSGMGEGRALPARPRSGLPQRARRPDVLRRGSARGTSRPAGVSLQPVRRPPSEADVRGRPGGQGALCSVPDPPFPPPRADLRLRPEAGVRHRRHA